LGNILDAVSNFGGEGQGGIPGSVKRVQDASFSLWSAWGSIANPQTSIKNSLHNDMLMMQVRGQGGAAGQWRKPGVWCAYRKDAHAFKPVMLGTMCVRLGTYAGAATVTAVFLR
jgi:hypothetical protein